MNRNFPVSFLFFAYLFFLMGTAGAQSNIDKYSLQLRTGNVVVQESNNIESWYANNDEVFETRYYRIVQFFSIPSNSERELLKSEGLELLDYLPGLSYFSAIDKNFKWTKTLSSNIRNVLPLTSNVKLHPDLYRGNYPSWSLIGKDEVLINLIFFKNHSLKAIEEHLGSFPIEIFEKGKSSRKMRVRTPITELNALAHSPFVFFIEPIDEPAEPENYTGRTLHRSNVLSSDHLSGRKYDGTGITIGMHDDGIIGPHIDYEGRIPIQFPNNNGGDHGDHVAGIIMGAGNLDPRNKGMAFGSDLYVYGSGNGNYDSVPNHYNNYNMVITSKSYSNGCNAGYTGLSRELDRYVRQYPSLMHVFSAGNNGTSDCGYGAGSNWGNITGGHKAGKNVIAVANLTTWDGLVTSSSRGPAEDGRIKPDIAAKGAAVLSTTNTNKYVSKTGTSMSCPGISGSLAQLYHAYRDLNSGNFPPSGLMKGILLNTADDLGNAGPDFQFGWGRVNNLRAVEVLENVQYFSDLINQGDTVTHNIDVPSGVSQLKVMVYWNDYEAASNASTALVNNLDFTLTDVSLNSFDPWVLDTTPTPAALGSPAVRGIDDLNNMEQVTINNPTAGIHTAEIIGKLIPQGPQEYFLIYSFVMDNITVTYPNGGESFVPGETEVIRWDAPETPGSFDLEYSSDNGFSWNSIGTVASNRRYATWNVPSFSTGTMRVRVIKGVNSDMSDTSFSVMRVPTNLDVSWSCPDSLQLTWNAVTNALSYEVSRLSLKYMDSAGVSSITSLVLKGIQPNDIEWFSVKAFGPNGAIGRRAVAIQKPLGTFDCPIDNDVSLAEIITPASSLPDCKDHSNTLVSVKIVNRGTNSVSNFSVAYQIDSDTPVVESVNNSIPSGDSIIYTFAPIVDFSVKRSYGVKSWVSLSTDLNAFNDTAESSFAHFETEIKQLPWSENFETFAQCDVANNCGGTDCELNEGWHNHENFVIDDIDWRTDADGTRTRDSGPSVDHNPGEAGGKYLYTETSAGCDYRTALLISPCIDLSQASKPLLSFWYHAFGDDIGRIHVDVLHQNKWVLDATWPMVGPRGDEWIEREVDLSAFIGDTINIRFRGITDEGPFGDMALDDINVIETDSAIGIPTVSTGKEKLELFPNPSNGNVQFQYHGALFGSATLSIMDAQGVTVYFKKLKVDQSNLSLELDLSNLKKGVYFVKLHADNRNRIKKLILQ